MALKGSFNKLVSGNFGIICNWKGTQNQSGNYTTITLDVYLQYYHLYVGSRDDGIVSINGKSSKFSTSAISSSTDSWKTTLLKSYSISYQRLLEQEVRFLFQEQHRDSVRPEHCPVAQLYTKMIS